jgi:hypothetical protein
MFGGAIAGRLFDQRQNASGSARSFTPQSAGILKDEHLVNFLYAVSGLNSFDYAYRRAEKMR